MSGKKPSNPKGTKRAAKAAGTSAVNLLKLGPTFYDQPCEQLAKALLGKVLVRRLPQTGEILRGTIVETEAYPGGNDEASSSFNGRRTERNEPMYMAPGTTFVYLTYGMYRMMNISSQGEGSACLLRGIEPQEDYRIMHDFRQPKKPKKLESKAAKTSKTTKAAAEPTTTAVQKKELKLHELANGPGKLCTAFGITREECNKLDLAVNNELWLEENRDPKYREGKFQIESAPRVGIDSAPPSSRNKLFRYFIENNFSVSTAKPSLIKKKLAAEVDLGLAQPIV